MKKAKKDQNEFVPAQNNTDNNSSSLIFIEFI